MVLWTTLVELLDAGSFVVAERPLALDNAASALLDDDARAILAKVGAVLGAVTEWTAAATEEAVKAFAAAQGLKLGKVAQPLRAALTGERDPDADLYAFK